MNTLSPIDRELLDNIKRRIVKASGLEDKADWVQKDYEFLVFFIEDQTGVSLSLSTIKRIWRNEYHRLPHSATLDVLSQLAYQMDWLGLKKKWLSRTPQTAMAEENKRKRNPLIYIVAILALLFGLGIFLSLTLDSPTSLSPSEKKAIAFSYKKSMDGTIPNTVVFHYDVESVQADRFFLQQSWDESRRVEIFKGNTEQTDIYYVPGFFTARLLADTVVIKEIPIHITHDDWFMAARQPMSNIRGFDRKYWSDVPYMGIDKDTLLANHIDLSQVFQLAFYQVQDFGLEGDDFAYATRFRMDPVDAIPCPNISLHVQGETGYYWIMFGQKGCESELYTSLGEVQHPGKYQDLTMFGTEIYQWQEVRFKVVDKKVTLMLNGKPIFSTAYSQPIGAIKEISYFFNGLGMIDDVRLWDRTGRLHFSEDFDSPP
ncbi:hypothetical protein WIW50_12465 [Flavobacteriaceae bacterium 3-367]